jgi:type I restriction enzyme, S subunit
VHFYLRRIQKSLVNQGQGGAQPNISRSILLDQPIPLAPTAEQRRILARIDELFAEIADGEAALQRARQDLDTWRRSLLKAAATGELTRDWREANRPAETSADLLARIRTEREACVSRLGRRRAIAPNDIERTECVKLPVGWVWGRMGDVALSDGRNGMSVKGSKNPPGIPALRLDALAERGIDYSRIRY